MMKRLVVVLVLALCCGCVTSKSGRMAIGEFDLDVRSEERVAIECAKPVEEDPENLKLSGIVSYVNPEHCAVCLTCVRACPYGVPQINEDHTAEINPALCHGCGICVAECPAKTITLRHYTQGQLLAKIESLPEEEPEEATAA